MLSAWVLSQVMLEWLPAFYCDAMVTRPYSFNIDFAWIVEEVYFLVDATSQSYDMSTIALSVHYNLAWVVLDVIVY